MILKALVLKKFEFDRNSSLFQPISWIMLNELKAPALSKFVVVVMFFVSVITYTNLNAIIFFKKHMTSRPIIIIKGLIIVYHGLLTHAERVRHFFYSSFPRAYVLQYWAIRPKSNLQFTLRRENLNFLLYIFSKIKMLFAIFKNYFAQFFLTVALKKTVVTTAQLLQFVAHSSLTYLQCSL